MSERTRPEVARTRTEVRRSWWPGWIWAIPLAAFLLVGWWLVRTFMTGGEDITISFRDAHGLKTKSTTVDYRGIDVGKVRAIALSKDGQSVEVTAHVKDNVVPFLRTGTKFWLRGANPSLSDLSSLSAVLSGPTIVMEAGPGQKAKHFVGLAHKPVFAGQQEQPDLYRVMLQGTVGRIAPGDPVKLRGFTVGEVKTIGFRFDAATGAIETPVTLALYPSLFHLDAGGTAQLASAVERLVGKGLRVRLERDPPLIGDPEVSLDMEKGAPAAAPATAGGLPQIPAAPGGGVTSLVDRVNHVPIDQIAQNLLDITHRVDALAASPRLSDAIEQLDGALAQIHETASKAGPQVSALVGKLRQTAGQLDQAIQAAKSTANSAKSAAQAADKTLGGAPNQNGVQKAMREVTEAARSVRELANYLDQHPEALIQGRSGG